MRYEFGQPAGQTGLSEASQYELQAVSSRSYCLDLDVKHSCVLKDWTHTSFLNMEHLLYTSNHRIIIFWVVDLVECCS